MIIRLTEEQYSFLSNAKDLINEDVFVNDIGRKRNRNVANLTYSKNSGYNKGIKLRMCGDGSKSNSKSRNLVMILGWH